MSTTHHSPHQTSRGEPVVPWTIDNSESRLSSGVENSPKGILKGSKTPNPYISPQFNRFQNERFESMANRRVSFASATRVRVYGKNETPNSPSHRTLSQRLSTTSPDENGGIPVATTISPEKDEAQLAASGSDNAFISRLSGSPMDRRKRRRDIFGSPPGQRAAKRPSVIYPEHRVRGMRKLGDDDDDDLDDDDNSPNYFMQFLSRRDQQGPKRLFDDDDDDNNSNNNNKDDARQHGGGNNDEGRATQASSAVDTRGTSYVSSLTPRPTRELSPNSLFAEDDNDDDDDDDDDRQHPILQPHRLSPFLEEDEETDSMALEHDDNFKQSQISVYSHNEDTGTMLLTQQQNVGGGGGGNNREQGTPVDDTMDLWNATTTTTADIHQDGEQQQQRRQSSQGTSQSSTGQHGHATPVASFRHAHPLGTQFSSQQKDSQDSDMKLTQDSSTLREPSALRETHLPTNNNYPFKSSSPIRTPTRSPFRSPVESTSNNSNNLDLHLRMPKSPRVGMSILDTMDASPILPRHSPLVDPSHTPPPPPFPPASNLFSPKRTFYLHDPTQSRSPLAAPGSTHATPRTLFNSPLRQEHAIRRDLSDHSIGSDYGDRMIAMNGDENFNIFEEELPQLYDSFIDDTPTSKPMTLAYFLDTAAGFKQLVEDRPMPRQTNPSNMEQINTPATFDQQATAAACILPELDAYRKLTEKYEQLNQNLTERLKQLEDDLSENIPQVFAEYANATPETVDEMESNFSDLRKLANAETEQEWYTSYIAMVQDLVTLCKDQLKAQLKDQQLLLQAKDRLAKTLPQLTAEKQKVADALKEAHERVQKYKQMDHKLLEKWERDIKGQKDFIEKRRKEAQQVDEKAVQTRNKLASLDEKKAELQASIAKAEATRAAHPYVSQADLERAQDQYESTSVLCACTLEEKTDHTIQYTIYDDLDVLIDTNKLKNHQMDAVLIRMMESRDRVYGPFAELVYGVQVLAKGTWNQAKIMQDIAIYWNRVRMIRNEILGVKERFWIDLEPHIQNPSTDTEMRGIRCTITVFSYMATFKFHLSFDIYAKNVMAYPHCLDLSQLDIDFFYGDTTPEYLNTLVKHRLKESGIVGLLDTLCSIIDDFR